VIAVDVTATIIAIVIIIPLLRGGTNLSRCSAYKSLRLRVPSEEEEREEEERRSRREIEPLASIMNETRGDMN